MSWGERLGVSVLGQEEYLTLGTGLEGLIAQYTADKVRGWG